ncbi:hypothetical protein DER29_2583 [Micromonospora sp. M71_S20]|uniref:hypothetical protein n=1 Tax=Micromonospora sp. M71_S20 TaxID=592872 RepID=UPI000EAC5AF5|nr:hypothetical protein [Micromonospora sp. M71_S20]RLK24662.1 hypothetical protein DER29_2583 [Micromonospora sp. M71_S20]
MTGDQDRPARGDIIEIGGSIREGAAPRWRRWPKWLPLVLAAGVGLAVYARTGADRVPPPASRSPSPPVASSAPEATAPATPGLATTGAPPAVTEVGRPLLGITGGWQLYGRGPDAVVRIEFARGRVSITPVRALRSTGPVSFLLSPDGVVIRPVDAVEGYRVPDGRPSTETTNDLDRSGAMLPGPDPESVWVSDGDGVRPRMLLARFDGRATGVEIVLPAGVSSFAQPDGAGYPAITATGGVYTIRPDGVRRITMGDLVAVGPRHWLARECDERLRCAGVLISHPGGARRAVPLPAEITAFDRGAISGDGRMAALVAMNATGAPRVHLLDLGSGVVRVLGLPVEASPGSVVWSPDGKWLFVTGLDGQLAAVDAATGRSRDLGVRLPQVSQLVVRPAAG